MKMPLSALAALLALAGCSSQPTAGGLTAEEERELDNAAAMLDQPNLFATAPDDVTANDEEEDAPEENAPVAVAANRSGNAQ